MALSSEKELKLSLDIIKILDGVRVIEATEILNIAKCYIHQGYTVNSKTIVAALKKHKEIPRDFKQ